MKNDDLSLCLSNFSAMLRRSNRLLEAGYYTEEGTPRIKYKEILYRWVGVVFVCSCCVLHVSIQSFVICTLSFRVFRKRWTWRSDAEVWDQTDLTSVMQTRGIKSKNVLPPVTITVYFYCVIKLQTPCLSLSAITTGWIFSTKSVSCFLLILLFAFGECFHTSLLQSIISTKWVKPGTAGFIFMFLISCFVSVRNPTHVL